MQRSLILLMYLLASIVVVAQSISNHNGIIIKRYTQEDGLPQNSVRDLIIDKNNFCWIASEMGLTRFDGKSFKNYSSDVIDSVYTNRFLLFTTNGNDLFVTNADQQTLKINVEEKNIIPAPKLTDAEVFMGHNGRLINLKKTKLPPYIRQVIRDPSQKAPLYNYAESDNSGYFYSAGNLIYFNSEEYRVLSNTGNAYGEFDFYEGNKYYALTSTGYILYINGKLILDNIQIQDINGKTLKRGSSGYFIRHKRNSPNFYIDAFNNVYEIKIAADYSVYLEKIFDQLPIKLINTILHDKDNNQYFIGTATTGLYIVKKSAFTNPIGEENIDRSVYQQYLYNDSTILSKNFLVRKNKTLQLSFDLFKGHRYAFKANNYYYIVTSSEILRTRSLESGQVENIYQFEYYVSNASYDSTNSTLNVFYENGWIDLNVPDFTVKKETLYTEKLSSYGLIPLTKDTFLCFTNKGLKWYNKPKNHFFKEVLPTSTIRSAHYSSPDNLWITTYGNGFYLYRKEKLIRFPDGPRNALKSAHAIFNDQKGHFWMTTNDGLYKVKIKDLLDYALEKRDDVYYYVFDRSDGLVTNEFNGRTIPNAFLLMPDSTLSLPTIEGLIWFNPYKTETSEVTAPIFISDIYYNNKIYTGNPFDIQLNYENAKQIKIRVVSPYFGNPQNIGLEYSINGEPIYFKIDQDGFITFNNISHGEYKITIRKKGISIESGETLTFKLVIKPPFYQTALFYFIVIGVLLSLIIFSVKRRIRSFKEQSEKLEQVVKQRTLDLTSTIERLETSEKALEEGNNMRENIIAMILHDLRSPLRFLTTISNHLYKKYDTANKDDFRNKLLNLKVSTFSILNYSENFFAWASSQRDGFTINKTFFNLSKLLYDIEELYTDVIIQNNNQLIIEDCPVEIHTDYNILSLVIRNLIDNANKNTENGIIKVTYYNKGSDIIIEISDTGKGLTEEDIRHFTKVMTQKVNSGFGSILILSLLPMINGEIKVESVIGKGTIFSIILRS